MNFRRSPRPVLALVLALAVLTAGCAANSEVVIGDDTASRTVGAATQFAPADGDPEAAVGSSDDASQSNEGNEASAGSSDTAGTDTTDGTEPSTDEADDQSEEAAADSTELEPSQGLTVAPADDFLIKVADDVAAAKSYRIDLRLAMRMALGEFVAVDADLLDETDPPLMTGVVSGTTQRLTMDMTTFTEALLGGIAGGAGLPPGDLDMEIIATEEAMYVRGGMLAAPGSAPTIDLAAGQWGFVDLASGDLADILGNVDTVQAADPSAIVDLLRLVEAVSEVGPSEIRGIPTTEYVGEVTLGQLMEAQGMGAGDLGAMLGADASALGLDSDGIAREVFDQPAQFEIHLDLDGQLRRTVMTLDMGALMTTMFENDPSGMFDGQSLEFEMTTQMDLYDYGLTVDIEIPTDAVDITDEFLGRN